jgi:hypothetical protein
MTGSILHHQDHEDHQEGVPFVCFVSLVVNRSRRDPSAEGDEITPTFPELKSVRIDRPA